MRIMSGAPGRSRGTRELRQEAPAADVGELLALFQFARDGNNIDRLTLCIKREHGIENSSVFASVERIDRDHVGDLIHRILVEHKSSEERVLHFDILRRNAYGFC
ncbi:MAG: hypothetical protein UY63_C0013G0020 [Parcubacteria group bacterium GW2011_GWA2_51_10]|nr:MAG: hypothetical protein UY63_C0013G0020 [Parcubacteria group bacterium GW2011_GWA2_51_10]